MLPHNPDSDGRRVTRSCFQSNAWQSAFDRSKVGQRYESMRIGRVPGSISSKLFAVLMVAAGSVVHPLEAAPASHRKPNIILILADDLGYGDLGSYGQKQIKTPNLDRMAAEGMRFTQFYAGSTVCAPSRAVLMTGRHAGHVSIRGNADAPLATNEITVAQLLKGQGYFTGCFGKWGLGLENSGSTPSARGFDEWFGYLDQTDAHNYYPTRLWRSSTIAGVADMAMPIRPNENGARGRYSHDLFTMAARNFIRIAQREPFFLFLPYTIPHANNELKERGMEVPSLEPYEEEPWPAPERAKAAMITRLDRDIGALLDQLKALRIESNTVVLFTSDNGPHREGGVDPMHFASAGPLRGIKRDLFEGGIRVPLIARWPGRIKPGVVSDQVWSFWDVLPTATELAGVPEPEGIDGLSFAPTLLGKPQERQHEFLYWEFHERGSKQAVRMGDWKAIRQQIGKPLELYHLKSDPAETRDVASENPEVVARIETYLKTARTESALWPLRTPADQREQNRRRRDAGAAQPAQ